MDTEISPFDDDDLSLDAELGDHTPLTQHAAGEANTATGASKHGTATVFHLLFKGLAIFVYLFCDLVSPDNFIITFVVCVLLLAFDFWTVKNVTGRLLVGLRWWNQVKPDGTNEWIYESVPADRVINANDSKVFWMTLYVTPVVWTILGIVALASLDFLWLLLVAVAVTLSGANLVGYWKCQKDQKAKLTSGIQSFIASRISSGASIPGL
jgi:hypothetical protein